ncbi:hypothetical protein MNV_1620004 [Candidatus Methanoperedens nitroreducens]|uniref:Uncharacterized protein n=1 Tax=Candidatus Methanoperedens nitratireducens TaxID=1392998 RepID=A0A284VLR4_9EURY|nr:hypothetical protein MNV_1620004 [Candidatus Methanoperedens nitroreducens]
MLPSGAALALNKFKANITMPSGKYWGSVALLKLRLNPTFFRLQKQVRPDF